MAWVNGILAAPQPRGPRCATTLCDWGSVYVGPAGTSELAV